MNRTREAPPFRFLPYAWVAVAHLLLIAAVFALFMGRKPGVFRSQAILDVAPGFYSHISNFSLSYILYAGIGFLWLMLGVSMRKVALAGLALVVANATYELLIPVLNTRDPVDAAYGVSGTLLALGWLWVIKHFGLKARADPAGSG